ncbi:magnesium chelatase subunit D [Kushneria avicenniae]|uniref:Magnesium chelatase subunit D n=1 Tax=Kushneria avicenniae TaxID=402385 RepID=A0A1I1FU96_9GAMM|nr:AAA family ATPase [Kushneria avicenniae]SFC01208.1 magnesium chelatase subunit D [Kushneria avicenniae]
MTRATRPLFPFAAVTGHERLKLALILAALDTRLGGVLVSGPRGTAKSTLARSLAELLPFSRSSLVTLPLGADEAQLTGTLDLGRALGEREVAFQPGLLARAHEGVLYIDEVNLLPDALVDLLLDVAASGINHIERDGISHQHPSEFLLIGTMNPDEGDLRPQLLDRFGLAVLDHPAPDIEQRLQIVERRLAFDHDPEDFMAVWQEAQSHLSDRLQAARDRLAMVTLPPELARVIAIRCVEAGVEGVRADLAWRRGALAHAAWQGRSAVTLEDIDALAPLVMAHRAPAWTPDETPEDGDDGHQGKGSDGDESASAPSPDHSPGRYQGRRPPSDAPNRPDLAPGHDASSADAESESKQQLSSTRSDEHHIHEQAPGDQSSGDWGSLPARPVSPVLENAASGTIQLPSVLQQAVGRFPQRQALTQLKGRHALGRQRIDWPGSFRRAATAHDHPIPASPQSLVHRRDRRRPDTLTCIVLDISGSSLSRQSSNQRQLEKAMALVERITASAYPAREKLMLLTLGGDGINEIMAPGRAPRTIATLLAGLAPGGGTPLRQGLEETRQRLTRYQRQASAMIRLWILTDARSRDDLQLAPFGCDTHVVDCESVGQSLGRARELATSLDATCHTLDALMDTTSNTPRSHCHTAISPWRTP